jgi:N-acetylglucosaminyldiphosphoundecaprenol N-acetyl-beta-D-mannosaminyltransferase
VAGDQRAGAMTDPRVDILGVEVSAIDLSMAVANVERWIASRDRQYVCVTGVHGVMESYRDAALRSIHNRAGMVTPDGMPLVWLCRRFGYPDTDRVYGPDLMLAVCERSVARGWRHYFYGGAAGVADGLAASLVRRFPGLIVAGTFSPPFGEIDPAEDRAIDDRIASSHPDIVWVGLSTPKQERWMAAHVDRFDVPVSIGVGAAFDFVAGRKPQAPRWMQRSGLEWLFRLATEPHRLWRRYLVNNPRFLVLIARQMMAQGARPPKRSD